MKIALRPTATALSVALLCLISGCRVGPKYNVPPTAAQTAPPAYRELPVATNPPPAVIKADINATNPQVVPAPAYDGWKVAEPQDAMLRGKWWEIYNDPELNALEDRLNIDNQNIKQFFENFMVARALIAEARSQLYPTLGTTPAYTRTRSSSNLTNSSTSTGTGNSGSTGTGTGTTGSTVTTTTGRQSSLGSLPLDLSWEPDLWGKIRNQIRSDQYNAQVSAADLENERLTEQASLAQFFFELRGQDALVKLYADTVAADQNALDITKSRYETGVDNQISVVEAQNTLQNAQATAIGIGTARAQYEHAIAVLIGTNASSFTIPVRPSIIPPPAVPVGVPSQLLERRPDIAAAERTMASSNALIGVATAAYYPALTLSATGGFESSTFKHLFDISSRFWSIGPSVSETIYDGGLRRATVNQYIGTYNANVATYRQTVLTAFQQVEDALSNLRIGSNQIAQQMQAQVTAEQYVQLALDRYKLGLDPYSNVVIAQTTLLTDQQTVTQLQIQQMTYSVNLIQALGGGWDRTQLPTPAQVSQKLTKPDTTIQQ
ncbi:NodT family efflux transporter outer membrane factor (OMF) lipoprotein [Granulicella aggregans]|uniref:NodT family efflux transporter outer membrane factor (OMF) lipoprotein n=1 Tax=Granulicella aggregans TaxID=474949 RepID=A0A7W7ZEV4_9BACT|nr:efflux transporter outer membrane subunit [Granulicella aggregans]MBB5058665.1 NodT family efflux transporter outer membrane factor (OMF) lipoprotein [Granulicella aggregans]